MKLTVAATIPEGKIKAIASKSAAHRALICAAFGNKSANIVCEEINDDISATVRCLCALGAKITRRDSRIFAGRRRYACAVSIRRLQ